MFNVLEKLKYYILNVMWIKPQLAASPAMFDQRGGTNDENVEVSYSKKIYRELINKTIVGAFSRRNDIVAGVTMFEPPSFDNTALIWSQDIPEGDEYRLTYNQALDGLPTFGDVNTAAGEFPKWLNQNFKINIVKSPAGQITGLESRKLVAKSITNIPKAVEDNVSDWMARYLEHAFIVSLLWGADPSLISAAVDGGKAVSLGPNSGIGAGTPLAGMHWWTPDTGFATYDASDLSGWNTTVNDAVDGIDAAAADKITKSFLDVLRKKLDTEHFQPVTLNGSRYKAICLCDAEAVLRIAYLLDSSWKDAMERGKRNPIFNCDFQIEYKQVLYVSVPNLSKYRPEKNAATGYIDIGPGIDTQTLNYVNSNAPTNALMIYCGAGAALMGKDGMAVPVKAKAQFGERDGMAVGLHQRVAFKRNQWESKDGRTESKCHSVLTACVYEPGPDW